jgi:hypothetical protein
VPWRAGRRVGWLLERKQLGQSESKWIERRVRDRRGGREQRRLGQRERFGRVRHRQFERLWFRRLELGRCWLWLHELGRSELERLWFRVDWYGAQLRVWRK